MQMKSNLYRTVVSVIFMACAVIQSGLALSEVQPDQNIDSRLIEIVERVDESILQANQPSLRSNDGLSENDLSAGSTINFIDKIQTSTYSKHPLAIYEALNADRPKPVEAFAPGIDNIMLMYRGYAAALETNASYQEQQDSLGNFKSTGSWLERYFAHRLSVQLYAENNDIPAALQTAQIALNIIPEELDPYTQYAKSDMTATIAQLHNIQGNIDLALETSLDYLELTKDDPDAKAAIDLINNLIYSHGLNRDHEALIFLTEKLLEIERTETSDIPGLSEYRISQAMNMSGQFRKGLEFARTAQRKSDYQFVNTESRLMEAVALAGLGRKSEARAVAAEGQINLSETHLLENEESRDRLYLGFLLAQGDDEALALNLYNRQLDVTHRKLLSASARDTTSMLAALENTRERQEERAAAARREAELQAITIEKQRTLNRALTGLLGFAVFMIIGLLAFLKFRERVMRALAIKTEEAASADKLKTDFLGMISHELRTPLNGIIGFSDILSQTHNDPDVRKKTGVILQSGHELLAVVEAMTDMARIDAGKMDILPETASVPELLTEVVTDHQQRAEIKDIAFTAYIDPDLGDHHLDGARLKQCVATLLANAISFTENGRVHLHATAEKTEAGDVTGLTVNVADTGVGMTDLVQSRLFTPFMQADTSLKRSHMGTGLSLAIAKALVDMMGGHLTVVSREGRGSEFTMSIPLAPAEMIESEVDELQSKSVTHETDNIAEDMVLPPPVLDLMEPRSAGEPAPLHAAPDVITENDLEGLRVLIVDDIPSNRNIVRDMLEAEACICFEAADGEEALESLHAGPFDAVIMDIHMSRMDGVEATRVIRNSHAPFADIPIVALTADNAAATNAACMAAGADIFLTKPVLAEELRHALEFLQTGTSRRTLSQSEAG